MTTLTRKQHELIARNMQAFTHNFGSIRIDRADYGNGFYVYYPANGTNGAWMYYAQNIHDLNGWLYGCVQGVLRVQHVYAQIEGGK